MVYKSEFHHVVLGSEAVMHLLIEEINKLEIESRLLDPPKGLRNDWNKAVVAHVESFFDSLETQKAYQYEDPLQKNRIDQSSFENPAPFEDVLLQIKHQIDNTGINTTSSRYFGFIPGGGLYPSALGDYIAAVSNRFSGNFYCAPGAVRIENKLLHWLSELIGYPKGSSGNLTPGGSIANMVALISARESFKFKAKDFHKIVIYLTQHTHFSVEKALKIIGMREAILRDVAVDEHYSMRAEILKEQIKKDREEGLIPWLIIASAGTTDVGSVDPIDKLSVIAEENALWLHIDAAYGGFFMLTEIGKKLFSGIEKSHSVTLDPHKSLFLPYGSGALIVRDHSKLQAAFSQKANCMEICETIVSELSPCDLSPELTRHFRAMRLWLPLQLFGVNPFRAALNEKLLLAQYFFEKITQIPQIQVVSRPALSIVAFRYLPKKGDPNRFNEALIKAINDDGRIYLSSTKINGNFYLRFAILSFRTHLQDVDLALNTIREIAQTKDNK